MNALATFGIDLPLLIGFAAACTISWFVADIIIRKLYTRRFRGMIEKNRKNTFEMADRAGSTWQEKLDLDFGKRIGRLERIFYIYAVMLGALTLLSAWVILKAFYGWIQKPDTAQLEAREGDREITTFYMYIYGNALSLMSALVLAHAGNVITAALRTVM